jgi:hypothetical protein
VAPTGTDRRVWGNPQGAKLSRRLIGREFDGRKQIRGILNELSLRDLKKKILQSQTLQRQMAGMICYGQPAACTFPHREQRESRKKLEPLPSEIRGERCPP